MKNLMILVLLNLPAITGLWAQPGERVTVPLEDGNKKGKLIVDIKAGNITIKGAPRKDVLVQYTTRGETDGLKVEDAGNGLKKISGGGSSLEIAGNGNEVYIEAENWTKAIDVLIEVPQTFDLVASTYNSGELVIQQVDGEIEAENYTGPITAENIAGSLVANTYTGDIRVSFKSVKPETPMAFTTYTGKIDLTLPVAAKVFFKMKTGSGDIYTAFDLELQKGGTVEDSKEKKGFRKIIEGWITGKLNGGGPEFRIETHMGDIYIRKG